MLLLFASCNIINPKESIPTYIRVDSFQFTPSLTPGGTNSHKITSVYVYFKNEIQGTWDLPALIPINAEDAGTLLLQPAIDYDAIHGQLTAYPFFSADTMTLTPAPGNTMSFIPQTSYVAGINVKWSDDFEGTNHFVKLQGDTMIVHDSAPSDQFEGSTVGLISLDSGWTSQSIATGGFNIDYTREIYLELNYRNTAPFQVGLQATLSTGDIYTEYLIGLKARTDWNKVYIDLRPFAARVQGTNYKIVIQAAPDARQNGGNVLIDNLRVLSF